MASPITVAYGDGIGPEIMEAVLMILREAEAKIKIETVEIGQRTYKKEWNTGISPLAWDSICRNKTLLKAPTATPQGSGHRSLNVALRKKLGLYANIRPSVAYYPIVETKYPNLDIVVVRENEEDVYTGIEHQLTNNTYQCIKTVTKGGAERICRYAFEYARRNNRKKVTCLVKDNIMKMTDGAFHKIFDQIAAKYPDIESNHYIVDIGMARIATDPESFDVIVTLNLYGDIISDIVSQLSGSVGMSGSANLGDGYAMFEAVHGSAPDIAGKGIANPSGLLNAAVQMLIYLEQFESAQNIYNAWLFTLEQGIHTADIYSATKSKRLASTNEFADAIVQNLGKNPKLFRKMHLENKPVAAIEKNIPQGELLTKRSVGVDISLSWSPEDDINLLAQTIIDMNLPLELVLIHSKGLNIWPDKSFVSSVHIGDQICCRFFIRKEGGTATSVEMNEILKTLDEKKIEVVKMERLYMYNNLPGFSTEI